MQQNGLGRPAATDRIRVHHAAKQIGCSERTVRRLIQEGTLPAERKGMRCWVVYRADVEIVASRRTKW
jgi:excisionase family DNA binding protein